ncbi:MAG: hypothetical protein P8Y83_09735, partial [Gammaproteobacteria bacterium]
DHKLFTGEVVLEVVIQEVRSMSSLKTLKSTLVAVFSLLFFIFAAIPDYAFAANPNAAKDSDRMMSASLVCGGAYWVNQSIKSTGRENASYWSFRNINDDQSLYINRIRVYDFDGSLFRDYRWTGTSFHDVLGSGTIIPADGHGNLSADDNELGPMQPSLYGHQDLYIAGVIPEYNRGDPNQIKLVIDWPADESVYPLWGGVLRYRGEVWMPNPGVEDYVGTLGRSSGDCTVINKVYK